VEFAWSLSTNRCRDYYMSINQLNLGAHLKTCCDITSGTCEISICPCYSWKTGRRHETESKAKPINIHSADN
jgi:hypothetical protein